MKTQKAQATIIVFMIAILLSLAVYSQSAVDPESMGHDPSEGLKALAGGYGAAKGFDSSIIMAPDDDW